MNLRLISHDGEYHYEWPERLGSPPAVLVASTPDKVWVRAASSTTDNIMYFEQGGWFPVPSRYLKKVK